MIKKFLAAFNKNLDAALEEKTSWGRIEIKMLIKQVISDTILEILE